MAHFLQKARKAQEIEATHCRATLNTRSGQNHVLHLFTNRHGAIHRSREGKLDANIKESLILFRQEACRERFPKPTGDKRHEAEQQQAEGGFPNQGAANTNVAVRKLGIGAIKSVKEQPKRASISLGWTQKQRRQGRAKR